MSDLREQFEAWWKTQRLPYGMVIAWQAWQAAHAASGRNELLEALEYVKQCIIAEHGAMAYRVNFHRVEAAIKKAKGEA